MKTFSIVMGGERVEVLPPRKDFTLESVTLQQTIFQLRWVRMDSTDVVVDYYSAFGDPLARLKEVPNVVDPS